MTYRVVLVQAVRKYGHIDIEAGSESEAKAAAAELVVLDGVVVKTPTWDVVTSDKVQVLDATEVAA